MGKPDAVDRTASQAAIPLSSGGDPASPLGRAHLQTPVSLIESHAAIVWRGKARVPADVGRTVVLDEVDVALVRRHVVLV